MATIVYTLFGVAIGVIIALGIISTVVVITRDKK